MKRTHITHLCVGLLALLSSTAHAGKADLVTPAGSGEFGKAVAILPNGNFVVTDPSFDIAGQADVGAAYLYDPSGTLISTLTGSLAGDKVGSGGVTVRANGNYVIISPAWANTAAAPKAGAVTLCSATAGVNGPVTLLNSLVGGAADNEVGSNGIVELSNGNLIVKSPFWDNAGATNAGAVTWINGATGLPVGPVTAANSLVGGTTNDQIGNRNLTLAQNGNYVAISRAWTNPATAAANAGAVTWINGATGLPVGLVTAANSLVGTSADDQADTFAYVLNNGNYVVTSPKWDNTATAATDAGAVTWGSGTSGVSGPIASSNSLVGTTTNDKVGLGAVKALPLINGNYVVISPEWNNTAAGATKAGAVTWGSGVTGVSGPVLPTNSLVGTTTNDTVGVNGVAVLTNGHYVVASGSWNNAAAGVTGVGAATWGNGFTGIKGPISKTNSLVGTRSGDGVGSNGVAALTNGNYVVASSPWDNTSAASNAGAATWGDGTKGIVGEVSVANSLVGTKSSDSVGFAVTPLTNGNYVVRSSNWDNGAIQSAGAATWGNGATGITGAVSPGNSLVGTSTSDSVGNNVIPLRNGNYVVISQFWNNGANVKAGAATWGNGTTGVSGPVSAANSLVGSTANNLVGQFVTALTNGNYVVSSPGWDGAGTDLGASTWGNGATGTSGIVSAANSLVGSTNDDQVGNAVITALDDGNYVVASSKWDNTAPAVMDASARTLCKGTGGTVGIVSAANSIVGNTANGAFTFAIKYDVSRRQLLVGRPLDSVVTRIFETGTLALGASTLTVNEENGTVVIPVIRTGGAEGAVTVLISTSAGTAAAGTDYMTVTNRLVTFANGSITPSVPVQIPIINDTVANEANETFKVTLSAPVGTTLGALSTATVRITDNDPTPDITGPAAPVITTPAAGAHVGVNPGAALTLTGTAADDKGISLVEVRLNDGPFLAATLTSINGTLANWSIPITPVTGTNTVQVRSWDTRGTNSQKWTTRSFLVIRPLRVAVLGGGTVTAGFAPSSFREEGRLLTVTATAAATPTPGFLFAGWSVSGPPDTLKKIGISADALERPSLTFLFKEGLQLTANFLANPYAATASGMPAVAGTYDGTVTHNRFFPDQPPFNSDSGEDGTTPAFNTEGAFRATVMSSGAFSGTLMLDGHVLNLAGAFDTNGNARFGTSRATALSVSRPNKLSLLVTLKITPTPNTAQITGRVAQYDSSLAQPVAICDIVGHRASFNNTTLPVPADLLDGPTATSGRYTVILPTRNTSHQPPGFTEADYPYGTGFATLTLTKAGAVTLAGLLPDNTPITMTTTLSQQKTCRFFAQLYNKLGIAAGDLFFDTTQANSDVAAVYTRWYRPILDSQHYPGGWDEGIIMDVFGAKFAVPTGASILPGLEQPADNVDGNANLKFTQGIFNPMPVDKTVGISTLDVVTKIPVDPSFTLAISRTTGKISGSFIPNGQSTPAGFQGMIYQKGSQKGGHGFFMTPTPAVKDYTGLSGMVRLGPQL